MEKTFDAGLGDRDFLCLCIVQGNSMEAEKRGIRLPQLPVWVPVAIRASTDPGHSECKAVEWGNGQLLHVSRGPL